jgi:hypothetical protein
MLRFTEVDVRGFEIDALTVTWEIEPADPGAFDPLDVEYRVYRSNSPQGPFDLLTETPLIDTYSFTDTSLNRRSFWRKFYYKVEATPVGGGTSRESIVHRSEVNPTAAARMMEAYEIVRRERMLLKGIGVTPGFVGVPCAVFIRRSFGQRCMECVNPRLGRGSVEKCLRCFNAKYVGGYFNPIPQHFNFNPSPQILQSVNWGEAQPSETDVWTTNYPLLTPGDVIIEPTNRRWRVARMQPTARLRVPIRQIVRLAEINRSDVEYLIPVSESLFEELEFPELQSDNTEFFSRNR